MHGGHIDDHPKKLRTACEKIIIRVCEENAGEGRFEVALRSSGVRKTDVK